MKSKVNIKHTRDIAELLDYVHDRPFRFQDIQFDKSNSVLTIPLSILTDKVVGMRRYLYFLKVNEYAVVAAKLIFRNVEEYILEDNAEVGAGDINSIIYINDKVIVQCGLPVTIMLTVSKLDIELQISGNTISTHSWINSYFEFHSMRS